MRKLLRLVVEQGTGKLADAPGYLVGGKTGTAEKVSRHGYDTHALLSSFVGVFPINDPRYFVMIIDRRAARQQAVLRLCHRRLGRGAGREPRRAAHGAAARNSTGRRRFARNSPFFDGRLTCTRRGGNLRLTDLMDGAQGPRLSLARPIRTFAA